MSPEQLRGTKNVDARTDIWALGVIIYELLSGTIPFEAETLPGLLAQIAADPPRPIAEVCANLPSGLAAIVMHCLEKDPARRFANVGELAVALLPYAAPTSRVSVERILAILGISFPAAQAAAALPSTTITIAGAAARSAITPNTSTSFGQTGGEGKRSGRSPFVWLALPGSLVAIGLAWFGMRALRPEAKGQAAAGQASASAVAMKAPESAGSRASSESRAPAAPTASAAPTDDTNAADAAARSPGLAAQDDLLAPLTGSARAAPSATSAPVEPRRVATPANPKAPVRRPSNPIRSQPLSNILDGRE
jgi:serine/threonine-protein kinase